jgi:hypothetical protein
MWAPQNQIWVSHLKPSDPTFPWNSFSKWSHTFLSDGGNFSQNYCMVKGWPQSCILPMYVVNAFFSSFFKSIGGFFFFPKFCHTSNLTTLLRCPPTSTAAIVDWVLQLTSCLFRPVVWASVAWSRDLLLPWVPLVSSCKPVCTCLGTSRSALCVHGVACRPVHGHHLHHWRFFGRCKRGLQLFRRTLYKSSTVVQKWTPTLHLQLRLCRSRRGRPDYL